MFTAPVSSLAPRMPAVASPGPARSIEEVLQRLDAVVAEARRSGSRVGLFAWLYREVTARVREGIEAGRFEDGARMERLDVIFANRYLAALAAHRRGEFPGRSWAAAFGAASSSRLLVIQHLLLGMNAHINLDLGVSAARAAPGAELPALRADFFEISRLLGEMLDEVQDRLTRVSPWLGVIDVAGCRNDEEVFGFCLARARDLAWESALCVGSTPAARIPAEVERLDRLAAVVGTAIRRPGLHLLPLLLLVRSREPNGVAAVLDALAGR